MELPYFISQAELFYLGDDQTLLQCRYHPEKLSSREISGIRVPAAIKNAVSSRYCEFVAGRTLAQTLLARQGCNEMVGFCPDTRQPLWPAGYLGSITHSNGLAACSVARTAEVCGLGIDIEHWISDQKARDLQAMIWTESEATLCTPLFSKMSEALTLVFSAKESLFKAVYPQCGRYFDCLSAEVRKIHGSSAAGQMTLELKCELSPIFTKGRLFVVNYTSTSHATVTSARITRTTNDFSTSS